MFHLEHLQKLLARFTVGMDAILLSQVPLLPGVNMRYRLRWTLGLTLAFATLSSLGHRLHGQSDRPSPGRPADELNRELDRYFQRLAENGDFAGSVAIARGDSMLFARAYGMASAELGVPNTTNTKFRIASVTKTFTAAAIAILAERGRLRLDEPIARFLPDFPNASNITVLNLLRHEAGLANPDYLRAFTDHPGLPDLIAMIGSRPPLFAPGSNNQYSNAGYNVLARVIEVASGMSYDAFLRTAILTPLNMSGTGTLKSLNLVEGLATGHLTGPPPANVVSAPPGDPGFDVGSGAMFSTAEDLIRWARAVHTERLFRRSALAYPYGWGRLGQDRRAGLEQTGLTTGYSSSLSVWFTDSLYIAILGNIESGAWGIWPADVARIVRGERVEPAGRRIVGPPPGANQRFPGFYATADHRIEIAERGGQLWLFLDGWPVPKYLSPTDQPGEFELRAEVGRIVFEPVGARGVAPALEWVFPEGGRVRYPRE